MTWNLKTIQRHITIWEKLWEKCGITSLQLGESFIFENVSNDYETSLFGVRYVIQVRKILSTENEYWFILFFSNPVPDESSLPLSWPPTNADRDPYLILGPTVEISGKILEEQVRFWDVIYRKYYRDSVPPPKPSNVISTNSIKIFQKRVG